MVALLQDVEDKICSDDVLIEEYTKIEGITPLDIIIEKEKRKALIAMIRYVMPKLTAKDRKVFWLYSMIGISQRQIGKRLNMSHIAVGKRIDRLNKKIDDHLLENEKYMDWYEALLAPQSILEAGSPTTQGYPVELLMKTNDGGDFFIMDGYRKYRSRWKCKLPEYFVESFGDGKTVCSLCERSCSRVGMRKVRLFNGCSGI